VRILLVDDQALTRRTLRRFVARIELAAAWELCEEASPSHALVRGASERFDLVATDLHFRNEEMSGVDLVRAMRACSQTIPILLYTAWPSTEAERVNILLAGADDVMGGPLDAPLEFVARVNALHRRVTRSPSPSTLTIGGLIIDVARREVYVCKTRMLVTHDQYALLVVLAAASPKPVSFTDLACALGYAHVFDRRAVIEAVRRLRLRLQGTVAFQSVKGFGYVLTEPSIKARCDGQ